MRMVSKLVVVAAVQVGVLLHVVLLKQLIPTKHFIVLSLGATGAFALYQFLDSRSKESTRGNPPPSSPAPVAHQEQETPSIDDDTSESKEQPAENTAPQNQASDCDIKDTSTTAESATETDNPSKATNSAGEDRASKRATLQKKSHSKSFRSSIKKSSGSSWNADEIVKGMFVGDKKAAQNKEELHRHNITHILSLFGNEPAYPDEFKYLTLEMLDSPSEDLLQKFPITNHFINEGRDQGGVLVHCEKGVSRSATIAIAYIMSNLKKTFDEATEIVTDARPSCLPNYGFLSQLKLYEGMGFELDGDSETHRKYAIFKMRSRASLLREKWLARTTEFSIADELARDPLDNSDSTAMKCRQCEQPLFSAENVITHDKGQDVLGNSADVPDCNCVFIYPVRWMAPCIENSQEGTLNCPKCNAMLGNFDWNGISASCSCKFRFKPAMCIATDAFHC